MKALRKVLLPLSWIYGAAVWARNRLFDLEVIKVYRARTPTIVVGNLAVGGTGKTPMVAYLVELLLSQGLRVATLSRGYGRDTRGYREVATQDTASQSGDEPLQLKTKFPHITVAVCEDRVFGVKQLEGDHDVIVLDDAYQHRYLAPDFSVLLFDYHEFFRSRLLLPAGDFRDFLAERQRADLMVVTKCPENLNAPEKNHILRKLRMRTKDTPVLYSSIRYRPIKRLGDSDSELQIADLGDFTVLLVTGIANPTPLKNRITPLVARIEHLSFADHYAFMEKDIDEIHRKFDSIKSERKLILTTEKDARRLESKFPHLGDRASWVYIPISLEFQDEGQKLFDKSVLDFYQGYRQRAKI